VKPPQFWTGEEVVIWGGGNEKTTFEDGAAYDVAERRWRTIAAAPILGRGDHVAAWTGERMIIWGGGRSDHDRPVVPQAERVGYDAGTSTYIYGAYFADGASYDPATDRWEMTAPAPLAVSPAMSAWTGKELVIVGPRLGFQGPVGSATAPMGRTETLAYSPATDSWRVGAPPPFSRLYAVQGVWTGTELMIWGGTYHGDGGGPTVASSYDPETDEWTEFPPGPLADRQWHTVVWTGDRMVVWGGDDHVSIGWDDGAAYDPFSEEWESIAEAPFDGRQEHLGLAVDGAMIVWGGTSGPSTRSDGAAYDPQSDEWTLLPESPISGRIGSGAVVAGDGLFVWGGGSYDGLRFRHYDDGALLHPKNSD
jgi:hypothetical protein